MRVVAYLVVLISLFSVINCTSQHDNLLFSAQECCISRCSDEEIESLRSELYLLNEEYEDEFFFKKVEEFLDGKCSDIQSHRPRNTDYVYVSCPTEEIDTTNTQQSAVVACNFTGRHEGGVQSTLSIMRDFYGGWHYYDYTVVRAKSFSFLHNFYFNVGMPPGNYTVIGEIEYPYSEPSLRAYATVRVKKFYPDDAPPVLKKILVPDVDLADTRNFVLANISAWDIHGTQNLTITVSNGVESAYGEWGGVFWNATSKRYYSISNLTDQIVSLKWNTQYRLAEGTYNISIVLCDLLDQCAYYGYDRLLREGFQASFKVKSTGCPAGKYRPVGASPSSPCIACAKGLTSPVNASRCTACPPGTYWVANVGSTSSQCLPCPAGTTGIGASWDCKPCPLGFYQSAEGKTSCIACSEGMTTTVTGSTNCFSCPYGTYMTAGKPACTPCAKGTYAFFSAYYCYPCAPGTYANTTGSRSCTPCPAGSYSIGASSCTQCPTGKTGPAGSHSSLNCY